MRQPNTVPVGFSTGAPPQTRFFSVPVAVGTVPTLIVQGTRENRFILLSAPLVGFSFFVGGTDVGVGAGLPLPAGLPYEVTLPGNQALYAVTNAPVMISLGVQIIVAITGDVERRL